MKVLNLCSFKTFFAAYLIFSILGLGLGSLSRFKYFLIL